MKRKIVIVALIILALILFVPTTNHLKDGGTVEYQALTYKISKVHRLIEDSVNGYEIETIVEIFGIEVYNNVK